MSVEIEYNLASGTVPDYAMFTEIGNAAVHAIVVAAKSADMNWAQTYRALCQLSKDKLFEEATDTAVRECVYSALEFYAKDQDFYGV